jgi:hypothetical protein
VRESDLPKEQLYRIVGVGLSNFQFEEEAIGDAEKVDVPSLIAEMFLESV